ncbi:DUF6115 domain-containing protein [Clostridium polynesiense]|uniref:DUF6115 domain-containing protein n=1 Tax=Clostridium polynesiense TaxID=1325933 RepID=UPI00058FD10A|nr:hypothetical protein [Clostridium polynesiense]
MVVFLILIAAALILFNYKAVIKENSFKSILDAETLDTEDYKLEIIALRKEFAETVMELQNEILALKNIPRHYDNNKEEVQASIPNKIEIKSEIEESDIKPLGEKITSNKVIRVKELIEKGLTTDEICEELSIGKGEVLLIKELYLK